MKVTYIRHSGFMVETESSYLLFDYWQGNIPDMIYGKTLYVFSSHGHQDHYSPLIFKLESRCQTVHYILSSDVRQTDRAWTRAEQVLFVDPYECLQVGDCQIETLKSTDEGVAFLVRIDGKVIYHAGDLHWWDWPGEPEAENKAHEINYKKEIDRIRNVEIDCAFVVLDPRQEYAGGWGMDYFLKNVHAHYIFPMHCWEDYGLIADYKKKNDKKLMTGQIMDIRRPGDSFEID